MTRSFPSSNSTSSLSSRSSAAERTVAAMLGIRVDDARILLVDANKRRGRFNDATALSHLDEVAAARQVWQERLVYDRKMNINIKEDDDEHSHEKKHQQHQQPEQPQTSSSSSSWRSRSTTTATTKKTTTATNDAAAASTTGDLNAFECCLCILLFPFAVFFS